MTASRTCPCGCGRALTPALHDRADTGVQLAWATRLLDIATQYQTERHPLAATGERWTQQFLLAGHGDDNAALPNDHDVNEWFSAVQAITKDHRHDLIRSRYSPSPRPHSPSARSETQSSEGHQPLSDVFIAPPAASRWAHLGEPETNPPDIEPAGSAPNPEPDLPAGPSTLGEFLSSDVTVDGFKALLANMEPQARTKLIGITVGVVVIFLVLLIF